MSSQFDSHDPKMAAPSRDAVRSRAWRSRHGQHLQALLSAAGVASADGGSHQSYMAQLKKTFSALWARALVQAPASMVRHDPSLTRAERRRISSVKNNRLCRHRHQLFLSEVERELEARGQLPAGLQRTRVSTAAPKAAGADPVAPAPGGAALERPTAAPRPMVANAPPSRPFAGSLHPLARRPLPPASPMPRPTGQEERVAGLAARPPSPAPAPAAVPSRPASPMPRPSGQEARFVRPRPDPERR